MLKIAVVLEPDDDGGFTAHVPTIPGCFSEGETIEETISNIREAIEMILEATDDDLIVGDKAKVFELDWDVAGSRQVLPDPAPSGVEEGEDPREARVSPQQAATQVPLKATRAFQVDPNPETGIREPRE
jgi:predicted RNase H-like HicB family nuclease